MPPTIHLVRHAQGYHSVSEKGHTIRDPELTPEGIKQCDQLRDKFPHHDNIELLLSSPLTRTLQTTLHAFSPCLPRCQPILALPYAQETTAETSDTGRPGRELEQKFNATKRVVDLSRVEERWFDHSGEYATDVGSLNRRARILRQWLKARAEREVVLVCHGIFCHYLTGKVDSGGNQTEGWWKDAEVRSYIFGDGEDAPIEETAGSRIARKRRDLAIDGETEVRLPN